MGIFACPYCNQVLEVRRMNQEPQKPETYKLSSSKNQGTRRASQGPLALLSKEYYFDTVGISLAEQRTEFLSNYGPFPLVSSVNQRKIIALVGSEYLKEMYHFLSENGFIVIFANEQGPLSYDKLLVADATFFLNVQCISSDMAEKAAYVKSIGKQIWWLFATA